MANSFNEEQEAPELATISELAENIVIRLPGCADVMVRKTIQEVYREFCRETKCLSAVHDIALCDGRSDYSVPSVFGGIVDEIREVSIDGKILISERDYRTSGGNVKSIHLSGRFVRTNATSGSSENPIISPSPWMEAEHGSDSESRIMVVKATEYPKLNSEHVPFWFIERHGDSICSGVLSRLMSMTGRAWSDPQQAADERRNYENAKSEERMRHEVPIGRNVIDTSMVL